MHDLKTIYETYFNFLYCLALKIVRCKEAAEDCVQDTFIKACDRLEKITDEESIRRLLCISIKNQCFNYLSKKKVYDMYLDRYSYQQEYTDKELEHELIKLELFDKLSTEVEKLPPQEKKVIELRYYEGYKESEIPDLMGLSLQTVKNKKTIVLKKLKSILNPQ